MRKRENGQCMTKTHADGSFPLAADQEAQSSAALAGLWCRTVSWCHDLLQVPQSRKELCSPGLVLFASHRFQLAHRLFIRKAILILLVFVSTQARSQAASDCKSSPRCGADFPLRQVALTPLMPSDRASKVGTDSVSHIYSLVISCASR